MLPSSIILGGGGGAASKTFTPSLNFLDCKLSFTKAHKNTAFITSATKSTKSATPSGATIAPCSLTRSAKLNLASKLVFTSLIAAAFLHSNALADESCDGEFASFRNLVGIHCKGKEITVNDDAGAGSYLAANKTSDSDGDFTASALGTNKVDGYTLIANKVSDKVILGAYINGTNEDLSATNNALYINKNEVNTGVRDAIGAYIQITTGKGFASHNKVYMKAGRVRHLIGAQVDATRIGGNSRASNNEVEMTGGSTSNWVVGGLAKVRSDQSSEPGISIANNNIVHVTNARVGDYVMGGRAENALISTNVGAVDGNKVFVKNSQVSGITAASLGSANKSSANGNEIVANSVTIENTISASNIAGNILEASKNKITIGGDMKFTNNNDGAIVGAELTTNDTNLANDLTVKDNEISLQSTLTSQSLSNVDLYAYRIWKNRALFEQNNPNKEKINNNSLSINQESDKSFNIRSIHNFDKLVFNINGTKPNQEIITLNNRANPTKLSSLRALQTNLTDLSYLKSGDKIVLIDSNTDLGITPDQVQQSIKGDLFTDVDAKYEFTKSKLSILINKVGENPTAKEIISATISASSSALAGANNLMQTSIDQIDKAFADKKANYAIFANTNVNSIKLRHNQNLKVNSFNLIAGVTKNTSNFTYGAFFEAGYGEYKGSNYLNNKTQTFTSSGKVRYSGVGLLAKLNFTDNFYTEAGLRFGRVNTNYKADGLQNFFQDINVDYLANKSYYSAHIGLTKAFDINDKNQLQAYSKLYYSSISKADTKIAKIRVRLEPTNSLRLRAGLRYKADLSAISLYTGAAIEREFSLVSKATNLDNPNLKITPSNLKGTTGIFEAGLSYSPAKMPNLNINFSIDTHFGNKDGISGNLNLKYSY